MSLRISEDIHNGEEVLLLDASKEGSGNVCGSVGRFPTSKSRV